MEYLLNDLRQHISHCGSEEELPTLENDITTENESQIIRIWS